MIVLRQDTYPSTHDLAGTFAGLMDLYECNYIGLRRLLPHTPAAGSSWISRVPGGLDLHLSIQQRFRYTTELALTYHFLRRQQLLLEPNLCIRIYHDARLAEVMTAQLRRWPTFNSEHDTALRARWQVNRFLYKWLNYCWRQGHRFANADPGNPADAYPWPSSTSTTPPPPR